MTTPERRADRWHRIEYPVLLEAARQVDAREDVDIEAMGRVAGGVDADEVNLALDRLERAGYVELLRSPSMASGESDVLRVTLEERGLRATGLWPDEDAAADALVQLLEQAAREVEDEEDQSALKRAGRLLRGVPSAVLSDVTAALIRQQAGI